MKKNQYEEFLRKNGYGATLPPTKNTMGYQDYVVPPNKNTGNTSAPSANPATLNVSPSVNPTPSITPNTNSLWDLYSTQLAQSNINQKAELAAINERANQYTNAYLKSLGLQGTNAGATQIAQNSANLMNAYREIDANEQAALRQYEAENRQANEDRIYEVYETALSNPNLSKDQVNDIITKFNPDMSTQDYIKYINDLVMFDGSTDNWEETRDSLIEELTKSAENTSGTNNERMRDYANTKNAIAKLKKATSKAEVDAIIKEYKLKVK